MSYSVIHDNFRVYNLQKFIDSLGVSTGDNRLYLGIGRPQEWPGSTDTETAAMNTIDSRNSDWEDICSLQRITSSDVSAGIIREVWKANTRYDMYRHDWGKLNSSGVPDRRSEYYTANIYPQSLADAKYYAITSTNDVFICIKQAKDTSGIVLPSVFEPGNTANGVYLSSIESGAGIFKAADGYVWKYICNTELDAIKFRTTEFESVKQLSEAPSPSSSAYKQWVSQQNSANYKRGIYCIDVLSKGIGYNGGVAGTTTQASSSFKVVGNGTGLEFTVTYGSSGTVEGIEITNPGHGYTFAEIVSTSGAGAVFDIVFTGQYGLGGNPVKDLSAVYLLINTKLEGDTGGLFTGNDYRKIMLVSNPHQYGSSTLASAMQVSAMTTLNIDSGNTGVSAFVKDQIITGSISGAKGYVVQWDDSTSHLKVITPRDLYTSQVDYDKASASITTSDQIAQNVGGLIGISSITPPTIQPFTGDILYSEYRAPLNRDPLVVETINIIIKF